jgi:hypothetical protein
MPLAIDVGAFFRNGREEKRKKEEKDEREKEGETSAIARRRL